MFRVPLPAPRRWADVVLLLGVLALALKMSYDISKVRDLDCGDEGFYMQNAADIPKRGLPLAEYAPLYCLWYRALSLVQPDRARLYYFSWQCLAFLLAAGAYALCRAAGGRRAIGLLTAFFVLGSGLVEVYPYPTYLACVVLAFGTASAARLRAWRWSLAALAVTLLLASYARPELATSFVVLCLGGLAAGARAVLRAPREAGRLAGPTLAGPTLAVVACTTGLVGLMGNPLGGGGRSFIAFEQHYALNVVQTKNLTLNPCTHFESICAQDFGKAATVAEAFRANPRAAFWHVSLNAGHVPGAFRDLLADRLDLSTRGSYLFFGLAGAAAVLGAVGIGRRLARLPDAPEDRRGLYAALLMLSLLAVPASASALVIYPRLHYLMPATLFAVALLAAGLGRLPRLRAAWARLDAAPALAAVFCILLALLPNKAHRWDVQSLVWRTQRTPPVALDHQKAVAALRRLDIRTPSALVDCAGVGRSFFADVPGCWVPPWLKTGGFWEFVRKYGVGVLVIDPFMTSDPCFRDDPEFRAFVSTNDTREYTLFDVPGAPGHRLAVRKDLLPACQDPDAGSGKPPAGRSGADQ